MKIIKKFLFIAGFFFFLIPVNTFANEGEELAEQIYTVSETEDISIEKVVAVYDFEGNEKGACMKCVHDGKDYGYVICDTNENIIEYSLGDGGAFIYDVLCEKIETGYYVSEVDCIFTTDMLGYYIEVCDGVNTYLLDVEGNTYETDGMCTNESSYFSDWSQVIVKVEDYTGNSNYTRIENYYNINAVFFTQGYVLQICNRYACGVVAMLAVCAQEGYFEYRNTDGTYNEYNIRQAFNYLWELSNTHVNEVNGIQQFGGTNDEYYDTAIEEFCAAKTQRVIDVGTIENPTWNQIINHVGQGESSVFNSRIRVGSANNYEINGHSVNVVGYSVFRNNTTGQTMRFLTVGNGWDSVPRYLKFDSSNFDSSYFVYVP